MSFEARTRHNPIDDINLNRVFPGVAGGWFSEQLALAMTQHFLDKLDILFDVHAGGNLPTVDYIYIRNAEELSRAYGSKLLYRSKPGVAGTMYDGTAASTTDKRGVKSVVIELGGGHVDQRPYVKRGVAGLENMLRKAGVLQGEPVPPPPQIVMTGISIVRPTRGGWLETEAPPLGERIAEGAVLGRVICPYTFRELEVIRNTVKNGLMVLSHLSRNVVQPGDYAYMVGHE
jgi:predicted deacylase